MREPLMGGKDSMGPRRKRLPKQGTCKTCSHENSLGNSPMYGNCRLYSKAYSFRHTCKRYKRRATRGDAEDGKDVGTDVGERK